MGPDLEEDLTRDTLLGGRVQLLQRRRGHRAGTDAVLLAALVRVEPGRVVADVGAGTGAAGLMAVQGRAGARLLLVERDRDLAGLAARNLALNGVEGRVLALDVLAGRGERQAQGWEDGAADLVLSNPPFLDEGEGRPSPEPGRASAHLLPRGALADWLRACAALAGPRGGLAVIHRADRIARVLADWPKGFGGLQLHFVHPRAAEPATRVLVLARRANRAPLQVMPPLVLHEADGTFTPLARALHAGEAGLA